jgi:hypothetical protein
MMERKHVHSWSGKGLALVVDQGSRGTCRMLHLDGALVGKVVPLTTRTWRSSGDKLAMYCCDMLAQKLDSRRLVAR